MSSGRDPARMKKTKTQAETMAFTSQLFYYAMKALVCFVLYKYNNILWNQPINISIFISLLIMNSYLIYKAGSDPGYERLGSIAQVIVIQQQEQQGNFQNGQQKNQIQETQSSTKTIQTQATQTLLQFCDICRCKKKLRTKHCFRCGRCVRKFDHHCPWIGTCVGQKNHCTFVVMTFFQTLQSCFTFWICFKSMQIYEYRQEDGSYGQQFGVFAFFALFMFIYIIFVLVLFFFHSYLVLFNLTTNQITRRYSLQYLKGIKGNPFNSGLCENIKMSVFVPQQGHDWTIRNGTKGQTDRTWLQKCWDNQYYSCC